jgi:hypothetical protein
MIRSLLLSFLLLLTCERTLSQTVYYSKSTGALNSLSTWGTFTNGNGTAPANFTSANCTYIVTNNTSPTITGNWTVSGANSKVQVGTATTFINVTLPSPYTVAATFSVLATSTLTATGATLTASTVHVNGAFVNASSSNPTLGTLASASTVTYSLSAAQTVVNATYGNLTLSGSGLKSLNNTASTTVGGALTINTGCTFVLNTSISYTCSLNGTLSGAGTVTGGANSCLAIGGSGNFGTLNLTSSSQTLHNFVVNRASSGTITLGGSLTIDNIFTHTNGILALNGNALTLQTTMIFPASLANGSLTGSATSTLSITGTSISNNLYFTAGAEFLGSFTFNSNATTLTLGTSLTVTNHSHSSGILNLNGQTLAINGSLNLPPSLAQGSMTGSNTSNLLISATSITNDRLFLTTGSQVLGNFTFNSPGRTLRLGTALSVVSSFSHTNGILNLNNQSLSLTGTVTFPASAANGTFTGNTTSNFTLAATSITNRLYFTVGAQALRNFTFNSPGLTLGMGTNLTLSGAYTQTAGILDLGTTNFTMNSAITFPASTAAGTISGSSTSTLTIGGTGAISNALYMTQSGTANYLSALTLNRTGATLNLGNTLYIVGVLTPTAGTFASGGNLVLLATSSTNVGRIGPVGGSVTGNVKTYMYAKGGNTGWTLLGSPGLTGRTFSDWDDNISITCTTCPDGYFNFASVYAYSETVGGLYDNPARYVPITSIGTALSVAKGWWLYLGNATTTSTDILLDVTGPVSQGNVGISLTLTSSGGGTSTTDHGFNLISNPYPSPISWTALRNANANVSNAIYVYNPDLSGYATHVNGISSPAVGSGGIGNMIPAGQGFYVKAIAATSLTAMEANKGASTQELLKQSGSSVQSSSSPQLMRLQVNGHGMQNETVVYFDPGATVFYDNNYDALYFGPDPGMVGIGTRLNGNDYTINGLPPLTQNYSIPVFVKTDSSDNYSISAADLQNLPSGACLQLHDNYTGLDQDLRSGPYTCMITDTEKIAARFVLNISINNNLSVSASAFASSCASSGDGLLVATATGSGGPWNYYWKDANNNLLKTTLNCSGPDSLSGLNAGSYQVDVNTAGTCDNGTSSFVVQSAAMPSASYLASSNPVIFYQDSAYVTFTNSSSNANTWWWDFGDGTGATCFDTTHWYYTPADYTVTLYAINNPCGDTAAYTEVISVQQSPLGITAVAEPDRDMFISRDINGYYAKFNLKTETGAEVQVYNLVGDKLSTVSARVQHNKVYIPLGEARNQVLIISVITDSGRKTYCKIVH